MSTLFSRLMRGLAASCVALSFGVAAVGTAHAQPGHDKHSQRDKHPKHDKHDKRDKHGKHGRDDRSARHGHAGGPPPHAPAHGARRGAGPQHDWYRGSRLPRAYRTPHYVVADWRGHHLAAPPRGYHWVQYGGDYLLIAVATGVIAQLVLSQ